jgi:hypothetical protein
VYVMTLPQNPSASGSAISPTKLIVPANLVPRQTSLWARKALYEVPPRTPSADSLGEAEADDGHRYHIKGDVDGRPVRASEWLCTHIAEEVQLVAPTPAIVERQDGSLVFGSRRVAGTSDAITTINVLLKQNDDALSAKLRPILSSIYALDLFLDNDDRHLQNYLSIEDDRIYRFFAFDFSRALFWRWPVSGFVGDGTNTRFCGKLLRDYHGFDAGAADVTLERLQNISPMTVDGFISRMPPDWLQPNIRTDFTAWWSGTERLARLDALREGMKNGSLL